VPFAPRPPPHQPPLTTIHPCDGNGLNLNREERGRMKLLSTTTASGDGVATGVQRLGCGHLMYER
jgi:hypothetical protein